MNLSRDGLVGSESGLSSLGIEVVDEGEESRGDTELDVLVDGSLDGLVRENVAGSEVLGDDGSLEKR